MTKEALVQEILASGCQQLQLNLPLEPLMGYLQLLQKWNKAYNLTAIKEMPDMAKYHLLDSLSILPWIHGRRIIDVGSGAGLPGIPLALACPDKEFVLLDSNGKKTRFIEQARRFLQLDNVSVEQQRAENYRPVQGFDTVISRAFSELGQMADWTQHLLAPEGIWLAMKGRAPEAELASLKYRYKIVHYKVPYVDGQRCCIIFRR